MYSAVTGCCRMMSITSTPPKRPLRPSTVFSASSCFAASTWKASPWKFQPVKARAASRMSFSE